MEENLSRKEKQIIRKYYENRWWLKNKKITDSYIRHICNKCNIKGKVLRHPYIDTESDEFKFGIVLISKYNKSFNKYILLLINNDYGVYTSDYMYCMPFSKKLTKLDDEEKKKLNVLMNDKRRISKTKK